MRTRAIAGTTAVAGIVAAVIGVTGAVAGHTNQVITADPDGRQEVKSGATNNRIVGDPDGRAEFYAFNIDGASNAGTLCYVLTVDGIAPASAAHIHEGARGENGRIVANLASPADGDAADCLQRDRVLPSGARAFPTEVTAQEILANPDEYYVNVHNSEYPGGALRGQLSAQAE